MHIIATFEYSISLELALSELENIGISKKKISAFPLDKRTEEGKLFDSMHQSDGISLFDLAAVLGSIFMLLGICKVDTQKKVLLRFVFKKLLTNDLVRSFQLIQRYILLQLGS